MGIGELIAMALEKRGMSHHDAINRCYFMDSKGLVCKQRLDAPQTPKHALQPHKVAFAPVVLKPLSTPARAMHAVPWMSSLKHG